MTTLHVPLTGTVSVCVIARRMVAEGVSPETPVSWERNGVPVFEDTKPLRWWAERTVRESGGGRSMRLVRLKPSDHLTSLRETGIYGSLAAAVVGDEQ